jgi:uncharacterized repeat protein (TIGR01451 family)
VDIIHDEILVANASLYTPNSGAILVFDRTANSAIADVAPKRRLEGSATALCTPLSVAADVVADELVVTNSNAASGGTCAQSVTTYSRIASGNIAPKRTVAGALTALNVPSSAAITSVSALNIKVKAVSASVTAGDLVGYTITATATSGPVWNVLLTDTLPAPTGMTWAMTSGSPQCTFSVSAGLLTCSANSLAKGQSITATISGKSTKSSCPGMVDQAAASYYDGTADVAGVSSQANINIKCK